MTPQGQDTYTYRGRSLEELVPRIRSELGDDAVIVARRETSSGGVGGFFAKREIEVEVRPGAHVAPHIAEAFAQQLAQAHERQAAPPEPSELGGTRPATGPQVDALPSSTDVSVDDLFPAPARHAQQQGLAALFNAGIPAPPAEPEPPAAVEVPEPEPWVSDVEPAADQPTGVFDYLGVGEEEALPEEVEAEVVEPEPEPELPEADPEPEPEVEVESEAEASEPAAPAEEPPARRAPHAVPAEARAAGERMAARGLRPGLAEAIVEEAISGLLPLRPDADPRELVLEALARRIPVHPLGRGPAVVGFVGPGGAGKTRCVARLAAAHARHGALPVSVLALRAPDDGAELTRLLAPYDVTLHAVDGGAEGAARIAALRGEGLVIVDTPGVSPRSPGELRALGDELRALAPDELHLTVSATTGPEAARELVGGVRELGVSAVAVTHTDETEILGTVIGLAIDCALPLSYLARGQAVEAGLSAASPAELAAVLLP
jgi:flagellar biosynthesis GTPase FlhF